MSRRRNVERHRRSLGEIREIMSSMKSLAYMETRKLVHLVDAQHAVVEDIERVARDFLWFHPETLPEAQSATKVRLVIGTERGFCGDFNHELLRRLKGLPADSTLLLVGRKLHTLLEGDRRVAAYLDGPNVLEEAVTVLDRVVEELYALQTEYGALSLSSLHHGVDGAVIEQELLPPFSRPAEAPCGFRTPPVMNLASGDLVLELADQYLFAVLYELFYVSLMNENHRRVAHLTGAVKHLDDESAKLARRLNALRQEEIVEEIEVIMLSTGES